MAPLISDVMDVRGTLEGSSVSALGGLSWTDGSPTQSASDSTDLLDLESARASGDGFKLQVGAASEPRTATLYVGSFCVDVKLEVRLGALVESALSSEQTQGETYTIEVAAASSGVVDLGFAIEDNRCTTGDTGELWLVAATVASSP